MSLKTRFVVDLVTFVFNDYDICGNIIATCVVVVTFVSLVTFIGTITAFFKEVYSNREQE